MDGQLFHERDRRLELPEGLKPRFIRPWFSSTIVPKTMRHHISDDLAVQFQAGKYAMMVVRHARTHLRSHIAVSDPMDFRICPSPDINVKPTPTPAVWTVGISKNAKNIFGGRGFLPAA
jgi:hypothetical protein